MKDLYFFKNSTEIQKYNGEILKKYADNKLVKVISNPTEEDLREFGYMEVVETEIPDYNIDTQVVMITYVVINGKIYEHYEVIDIENLIGIN